MIAHLGHLLLLCLCLAISDRYVAQVVIDPSFNPNDPGHGIGDGPYSVIDAVAFQSNGKAVLGGVISFFHGNSNIQRLLRLGVDGLVDPTFNPTLPGALAPYTTVSVITVLPDDRMLIAARSSSSTWETNFWSIFRTSPDGTADATFNPGFGRIDVTTPGAITDIVVLPDERIVVTGGQFTSFNGVPRRGIVCLNADGTINNDFVNWDAAMLMVSGASVTPDGHIMVFGNLNNTGGAPYRRIMRLTPDGAFDPGFDMVAEQQDEIHAMDVQADGDPIIAVRLVEQGILGPPKVLRLSQDGTADPSFTVGAATSALFGVTEIKAVRCLSNGKILVGGRFDTYQAEPAQDMVLLAPDGTPDLLDDPNDRWYQGNATLPAYQRGAVGAIAADTDGGWLVTGTFIGLKGHACPAFGRFSADGSYDPAFHHAWSVNGHQRNARAVAALPDGTILVGGNFNSYAHRATRGVVKLDTEGSIDTTFDPGIGITWSSAATMGISVITPLPDGTIMIGGSFNDYNGTLSRRLARILPDGAIDGTFTPATFSANTSIRAIAYDPNGKLYVGGEFTQYDGFPSRNIVRLNTDGSVDTGFQSAMGSSGRVNAIIMRDDGKILIGGDFTTYDNAQRRGMALLQPDGGLDPSFMGPMFNVDWGGIVAMALQPDGKVVIGGRMSTNQPYAHYYLTRLLPGGSIDPAFFPPLPVGNDSRYVHSIVLRPDGTIVYGGQRSTNVGDVVGLLPNGLLDPSFGEHFFNSTVLDLALQPDDKVLVVGSYKAMGSIGRNRILRLQPDMSLTAPWLPAEQQVPVLWPNPVSDGLLHLRMADPLAGTLAISLYDAQGRLVHTGSEWAKDHDGVLTIALPPHLATGMHLLTVKSQNGMRISQRFIVE